MPSFNTTEQLLAPTISAASRSRSCSASRSRAPRLACRNTTAPQHRPASLEKTAENRTLGRGQRGRRSTPPCFPQPHSAAWRPPPALVTTAQGRSTTTHSKLCDGTESAQQTARHGVRWSQHSKLCGGHNNANEGCMAVHKAPHGKRHTTHQSRATVQHLRLGHTLRRTHKGKHGDPWRQTPQ
jgi:hypothetical protein